MVVGPLPTAMPTFDFPDVDPELVDASEKSIRSLGLPDEDVSAPPPADFSSPQHPNIPAEALLEFEKMLPDLLSAHDQMMSARWKKEAEIEDAYAMIRDAQSRGAYPGAAQMVSESLMSTVDQTKARIVQNLLSVDPLMRVKPIASSAFAAEEATQLAEDTERFFDSYTRTRLDIDSKINQAGLRTTKVGTTVFRVDWLNEFEERKAYQPDGTVGTTLSDESRVRIELIPNKDVILWPPTGQDWQEEYELVGHRAVLTVTAWRSLAQRLQVPPETIRQIEAFHLGASSAENPDGSSFGDMPEAKRAGMDTDAMSSVPGQQFIVITELWGRKSFEPEKPPVKFQLFYHEGLRKILSLVDNPFFSRKHPYFPLRYKTTDGSAWGTGAGHEAYMAQVADSMFRNLEVDNLQSSAFSMILLKDGSIADEIVSRPYPGIRVPTEDPAGDVEIKSMAQHGPLEMIYQAINANESRRVAATGQAQVLSGQGDPTMKSGAGTGSTMALIEQAGKKFGDVDATIRRDWSKVCEFMLDLVFQYAPNGVFYEYADPESAGRLIQAKYMPPRGGTVSKFFKITAEAPSAANNKEMFKNHLTMLYNFFQQHVQLVAQFAAPIYQQQNPAGQMDFFFRICDALNFLALKLVEANDIESMRNRIPYVHPPTPLEQQVSQLMFQNQQMQQQLMAAQGQQPQQGMATGG